MKRIILFFLAWLFLIGTAYGETWTSVRKDDSGTMSNVSGWQTSSGQSIVQVDTTGGISIYANEINIPANSGVSQLAEGTAGQIATYTTTVTAGGVDTISGASITDATITNAKLDTGALKSTEVVYGGVSTFYIYSGTTLTDVMLAGGMLFVHTPLSGSTPTVLGIPAVSSGATGFFGVWDMTGGGVTVQTSDADPLYDDSASGTAYFVNEGNSRHMASFKLNYESGSCAYVIVLGYSGSNWDIE